MSDIIIVTENHALRVPRHVWAAFLKASSLMIDTGDMYPHLKSHVGKAVLDEVKEVKAALDDHMDSSSAPPE